MPRYIALLRGVSPRILEKALGKNQTTRTWDTVRKCATG
jgi:hypothetical protein